MNKKLTTRLYSLVCTLFFSFTFQIAQADGPKNPSESWATTQGGKLYDNWAKVLYFDTSKLLTHPSYPKAGKKKGPATWRCKECHGWDYKGVNGAYGSGSHYTGIKGLRNLVGQSTEKIADIIRDKRHGYTETMLPDGALKDLAFFVSRGQVDMDQYIERNSNKPHGNADKGAAFFQNICANCHGYDGKLINFKTPPKIEYIGTVASDNPWEVFHKIRNGQPGSPMVALGVLSIQDQIDILAYLQTLPEK